MLSFLTKRLPQDILADLKERLRESPIAHRLARGAVWSLGGAVSTRILTLVSSAIVVRLLGKESFGEFGMVQSTLAMLGTFAGLGLGVTATKHVAELRTVDRERAGGLLGLLLFIAALSGVVMSIAGWVVSEWIAVRTLDHAALAPYLRLSSILVLIGVLDGVMNRALAGFEAFPRIAKVSVYAAVLNPLIMVPFVYRFGLMGAVVGLIFATGIHMLLNGYALLQVCRNQRVAVRLDRDSFREWPVMVHYALPALAAGILVMPAMWLANVILIRADNSDGFSSLAVVNVVNQLKTLAIYLPTVLLAPTFAILSNVAADNDAVQKTLRYAIGVSALAVFPVALLLTSLGSHVLSFIYGPEYAEEGIALAFAMIVAGIQATGAGLGSYLQAVGRMWLGLLINLLWGIVFVLLSLLLIPRFGASGYLAAMAAAYLLNVLIIYSVFSVTIPSLLKCYPLCRALLIFVLLTATAAYANAHFALLPAFLVAVTTALFMTIVLAIPFTKWWISARSAPNANVDFAGGN